MLGRLQRGLETLYRIDTQVSVDDFVIDEEAVRAFGTRRHSREQLLIAETDGEVEIGLFVDDRALSNLADNDPSERLGEHNLPDFLLAVEGVSHFIYTVWRASADRSVSALELELQAEVDKYVTCVLLCEGNRDDAEVLRRRLFHEFEYCDDLDETERDRYQAANANASRYSASLEQRYIREQRIADMLGELRRFYRMSLTSKLDFIRRAA